MNPALPRVRRTSWLLRVPTVLTLVALMLPAFLGLPAGAQSQQQQLDQIEDQIEDAEGQVGAVQGQIEISLAELDRILVEQQRLQTELDARNDELAHAQATLEDRERVLAATTAALELTGQRLDETRALLDRQRESSEARVRESYIAARPTQSLTLLAAEDVQELTAQTRYLQAIIERDRAGYELMDVLRRQIEADEDEQERLRSQQAVERAAAEQERDRVSQLVVEQQALVDQVEAQAQAKQVVIEGLEADRATAEALVANLQAESDRIEAELRAAAEAAAAAANGTRAVVHGSGRFIFPVPGGVGSGFGYRVHPISGVRKLHTGVDLHAGMGEPIAAAGDGTVIFAGWRGGYGNCTMIDHGGGLVTLYGHQSRIGVSVGQAVSTGQIIGYVGSTGYSTGPHLHWEVRVNGTPVDPLGYV